MTTSELTTWDQPTDLADAKAMASLIAASPMAGAHAGQPNNVLICMMISKQIAMPLMAVLQNVAVINGRPCIWGDLLIALARRHPECVSITETAENDVATCTVRRRTGGEVEEVTRKFSKADAQLAGLWSKGPWKQYPSRMLQVRARAFAIRDALPDAIMGLAVAEEQQDVQQARTISSSDRMKSLTAQIKGEEPTPEHTPADMPADVVDGELIPAWKSECYMRIASCTTSAELKSIGANITRMRGKRAPEDLVDLRGAWKERMEAIEAGLQEVVDEGYVIEGDEEPTP